MKLLELFAGSRSVGTAAQKLGFEVFSVDWTNYENIYLVIDIEDLTANDIPFIPDIIWASPDCTTYTIAAISHHRNGTIPISDYAKKCDRVNQNFIGLIYYYLKINSDLKFFIENPRGMFRKMPFVIDFERATVCYCKYGDDRMKPTDIFTNNLVNLFKDEGWKPMPMCYNGNKKCHHEAAPRGSKTGTQGKDNHYERSRIPEKLCNEILKSCIKL